MDFCIICRDREDLTRWEHPTTKEEHTICGHCKKNIVGTCRYCDELVFKIDHFGYDEAGNLICSKCVHLSELREDSGN